MPKRNDGVKKGKAPEKKTIKKNAFKERFLKYLEEVEEGLSEKLQQVTVKKVAEVNQPKIDMAFAVFAEGGEKETEIKDEENVEIIKDILFHYHTAPEKTGKKAVFIQITPPLDEETPHVLSYQEYSEE